MISRLKYYAGALVGAAIAAFIVHGAITAIKARLEVRQIEQKLAMPPPVVVHETGDVYIERGVLHIHARAERFRDCPFEVYTEYRSSEGRIERVQNPNKVILDPGNEAWIIIRAEVPISLPQVTYAVRSVAEYDCDGHIFKVGTAWKLIHWDGQ